MSSGRVHTLSVGGSILSPDSPDTSLIAEFTNLIGSFLDDFPSDRIICVVGGGGPARVYQEAGRKVLAAQNLQAQSADLDWIGVMATRLNAELLRVSLGALCTDPVVTDPSVKPVFTGRVLVGAGWKPGFSTDFDAVLLAGHFGSDRVVNLSNIERVYSDDPRKNPAAKPFDTISWEEFSKLVGDSWNPGANLPFDPIATRKARENGLVVVAASGRNLPNLDAILRGGKFTGTVIGG